MEKYRLYLAALLLGVTTLVMSGCTKAKVQTVEEEAEIVEEPVTEERPEIIQPLPEPEQTAEAEPADEESWFDRQELSITPQGDFTFVTAAEIDGEKVEIEAAGRVSIRETTEGCEEGCKRVICDIVSDYGCIEEESGYAQWVSAFDRYTGMTFEFAGNESELGDGDSNVSDGGVRIVNGDETYNISVGFEEENDYPYWHDIITIICPAEYDGTVFQVGYWDGELAEQNSSIDYTHRNYVIDELPAYDTNGHRYYYFSYADR